MQNNSVSKKLIKMFIWVFLNIFNTINILYLKGKLGARSIRRWGEFWLVGFFCCFIWVFLVGLCLVLNNCINTHPFPKVSFSLFFQLLNRNTLQSQIDIFIFFYLSSNSLHKEQEHTWARVVSLHAFLASWNKRIERVELERQHWASAERV